MAHDQDIAAPYGRVGQRDPQGRGHHDRQVWIGRRLASFVLFDVAQPAASPLQSFLFPDLACGPLAPLVDTHSPPRMRRWRPVRVAGRDQADGTLAAKAWRGLPPLTPHERDTMARRWLD